MFPTILSLGLLLYVLRAAYDDIVKLNHDKKEVLIALLLIALIYGLGYWTGHS